MPLMSETSASALHYVCNIVEKCQQRGGYTLDEAVELHKCVKNIRMHYKQDNFGLEVCCLCFTLL